MMKPTYVPIMKGKLGELNALAKVGDDAARMLPIVEVMATGIGEVPTEAAIYRTVAGILHGAIPDPESWASTTLALGAFPSSLTDVVKPGEVGRIPRLDLKIWKDIAARARVSPAFGDYGIGHPLVAQGATFAPAPQIRYTAPDEWIVLRGVKGLRRGASQFYDICAQLVQMPEYRGEDFSWGDELIAKAARSATGLSEVGPGNATTWRSIGTSHHLAQVVADLATRLGS